MASARDDSLSERDRRELAALADGALAAEPAARLEARVASSPALGESLRRQRRAVAALGAIELAAPARLRARVEAEARAPATRRFAPLAWAGAAAAVAAVAVAVVLLAGGAAAPTVDEAARLAALPPTSAAPAARPDQPTLLAAEVEGLAFPDWSREFGWRANGERDDRIGDRDTRTVYYAKDGGRIAYTIVSGEPLEPQPGAETTTVDGVEFAVVDQDGRTVVTWLREGHTCVLSGAGVARESLVELAAWKGDGAVAF